MRIAYRVLCYVCIFYLLFVCVSGIRVSCVIYKKCIECLRPSAYTSYRVVSARFRSRNSIVSVSVSAPADWYLFGIFGIFSGIADSVSVSNDIICVSDECQTRYSILADTAYSIQHATIHVFYRDTRIPDTHTNKRRYAYES